MSWINRQGVSDCQKRALTRPSGLRLVAGWLLVLASLVLMVPRSVVYAQEPLIWETAVIVSPAGTFNWYPDIAVDIYGSVHIVWDGGLSLPEKLANSGKFIRLVMHTHLKDGRWSTPLDVVSRIDPLASMGDIYQANLTADPDGNVLLSYAGILYRAQADQASLSATNWTPFQVSRGVSYIGEMLVDQNGTFHALYDEVSLVKSTREALEAEIGLLPSQAQSLSDVKTRRSFDRGLTWTAPADMSQTTVGETRANLEVDPQGVIYATWDEGWDRLTRFGQPTEGVLTFSKDGGVTWSSRKSFSYPDRHNAQFVAVGDGQAGILAVWRATTDNKIYYSWSTNEGESWAIPQAIPNIFARTWDDLLFDNYDLAVDSSGIIHLAAVARLSPFRERSNLYHLTWDGQNWSPPQQVDRGLGWPEAPRMTISQGNQLHMTWFTRDFLDVTSNSQYQIWYGHTTLNVPAEALPPPPPPPPVPTATALPLPTVDPAQQLQSLTPDELAQVKGMKATPMENDLQVALSKGLIPVILVIASYVIWSSLLKPRWRR